MCPDTYCPAENKREGVSLERTIFAKRQLSFNFSSSSPSCALLCTSEAPQPLYRRECTARLIVDGRFTIFPRTPACLFGLANYAFPRARGTNSMLSVNCSAWIQLSPSPASQ